MVDVEAVWDEVDRILSRPPPQLVHGDQPLFEYDIVIDEPEEAPQWTNTLFD